MRRSDIEAALSRMGANLIELSDAARLSLAYDSLARASELVALNVGDVQHGGNGATVYFVRSKADEEGAGQYRFVAPDTFAQVAAWVAAARLDPAAPLYIPMSHAGQGERITPRDVSRIYQPVWAKASLGTLCGAGRAHGAAQRMKSPSAKRKISAFRMVSVPSPAPGPMYATVVSAKLVCVTTYWSLS